MDNISKRFRFLNIQWNSVNNGSTLPNGKGTDVPVRLNSFIYRELVSAVRNGVGIGHEYVYELFSCSMVSAMGINTHRIGARNEAFIVNQKTAACMLTLVIGAVLCIFQRDEF